MATTAFTQVLDLIKEANDRGISFSFVRSELVVRFPQGKAVDPAFIQLLKHHKPELIEYFGGGREKHHPDPVGEGDTVTHGGQTYYRITPTQQYWLDLSYDAEFKNKMYGFHGFRVQGDFDPAAFRATIAYLVDRHESLRSTFEKFGDQYYMRVHQADAAWCTVAAKDAKDLCPEDPAVDDFIHFRGHCFDPATGPLLVVRVVQMGPRTHAVAIKSHHVIHDGWSMEILIRDLLTAYLAFARGESPSLPALKFQYKEHLALINQYARGNRDAHRQYWLSRYPHLPPVLQIPGAKRTAPEKMSCRPAGRELFLLTEDHLETLRGLSRQYATSLVIVLQAAFQRHLGRACGCNDTVIGMELFNRDLMEGSEHQIGFYAKMVLVRTALDAGDSLGEAVRKVKKSSEDTQKYRAFSLADTLTEMLPPGENLLTTAWKVTFSYKDLNGYFVSNAWSGSVSAGELLRVERIPDEREENTTNVDLHLSFVNLKKTIELTVTYDNALYDGPVVAALITGFINSLAEVPVLAPDQP